MIRNKCDRVRVCQVEEVLVVGSLHLGGCPGRENKTKESKEQSNHDGSIEDTTG